MSGSRSQQLRTQQNSTTSSFITNIVAVDFSRTSSTAAKSENASFFAVQSASSAAVIGTRFEANFRWHWSFEWQEPPLSLFHLKFSTRITWNANQQQRSLEMHSTMKPKWTIIPIPNFNHIITSHVRNRHVRTSILYGDFSTEYPAKTREIREKRDKTNLIKTKRWQWMVSLNLKLMSDASVHIRRFPIEVTKTNEKWNSSSQFLDLYFWSQ